MASDLPRALEKEFKDNLRPVPARHKVRAQFYRIDEFGKIDCLPWMRPLLILLVCLAFVSTLIAAAFVGFFIQDGADRSELAQQLHSQEQTIQDLVNDKEILMARLVLSGHGGDLDAVEDLESAPFDKAHAQSADKVSSAPLGDPSPSNVLHGVKSDTAPLDSSGLKPADGQAEGLPPAKALSLDRVGIEAIQVMNDPQNGDLLVRFNVRNRSPDLDAVAGYVFVVLKPPAAPVSDGLVLPAVAIDRGRPADYKKGQYFSIAHFKPVKFRVKSALSPDAFSSAAVFVFDGQGGLIFMQDILLADTGAGA